MGNVMLIIGAAIGIGTAHVLGFRSLIANIIGAVIGGAVVSVVVGAIGDALRGSKNTDKPR